MESRNTNILRFLDWPTVIIYVIMVVAGVFSIYAASYDFDQASILSFSEFSGKQIRWIGLAFALAVMLLLFDARIYENYAVPIYILIVIILIVTIFVAPDIKGSRSWLVIGSMSIQPAEFGKFATALALAKLFSSYNFKLNASAKNYAEAIGIILLPIALILAQRETGSALAYLSLFFVLYREGMSGLVLLAAFCAVLFFVVTVKFTTSIFLGMPAGEAFVLIMIMFIIVSMVAVYCKRIVEARNLLLAYVGVLLLLYILQLSGISVPGMPVLLTAIGGGCVYLLLLSLRTKAKKYLITIGAAVLSVVFLFFVNFAFTKVLQPHQQQRIRVTLGIEDDLLGAGYNVNQSKIAIGSGGITGKGFLNGTQSKLKYVPEQHTDFIYCTIGEEEGFIGSSLVLLLFLALILRVIHIAERQPSVFGRVYGYCVASYFIFHLAINIGMVIGLCPVIGIPLPFFSYGGSSLWSFTILLFILLRIDAARRDHPSYG